MIDRVPKKHWGTYALVVSAILYATMGPLIRIMDSMWSEFGQVAARWAAALGILLLISLWRRIPRLNTADKKSVLLLSIVTTAEVTLFTYAVIMLSIGNTLIMLYTGSLITSVLIGGVWFKEHINGTKSISLILALCGLALYLDPMYAQSYIGLCVACASGIANGIGNGVRRNIREADKISVMQLQFILGVFLISCITMVSGHGFVEHVSLLPILATIVFGIIIVSLNYLLLYGFSRVTVTTGSIILSSEIAFGSLFGFLLYNEVLTGTEVLAALLIMTATVLISLEKK